MSKKKEVETAVTPDLDETIIVERDTKPEEAVQEKSLKTSKRKPKSQAEPALEQTPEPTPELDPTEKLPEQEDEPKPSTADVSEQPVEVVETVVAESVEELAPASAEAKTEEQPPVAEGTAETAQLDPTAVEQVEEAPQVAVQPAVPYYPLPKRKSLFARLFGWLGRKKNSEQATELVQPEAEPELLTEFEKALPAEKLKRVISSAKKQLAEVNAKVEKIEADSTAKTDSILTIDEEMVKLDNWSEQSSRTFVFKVQQKMQAEQDTAKADMERHEAAVKNLKVLEPGLLLRLRKSFHKSLTWALIVCGIIMTIATIIKFREQIPRLDWLSVLYDPNVSGPILIALVSLLIGLIVLFTRKAGKQKINLSAVLSWTVFGLFIAWVIWDSSQSSSFMQKYVNPWVEKHYFEILTWTASIWTVWVISSLIVYYRNWSIFQRDVDEQIHGLQAVIDGYVKTQQELVRLGQLHKQVNEWLRIIANALFRPWRVNPDWGTSKEYSRHYETFPFALRVAQALEGNDSRMAELERIIGGHLLVQGWRDKAFQDLIAAVGNDMGLPEGRFSVDLLDHDLPQQTNNSRMLLAKYLDFSASNADQPLTQSDNDVQQTATKLTDQYLVTVAKTRLLTLIEKTQSHAIATARPRVEQIIDDPLLTLRSDESGIDSFDSSESWDDFLTDALGAGNVNQFPLGVLTFAESSRIKNLHSNVKSYVVVPKRLAGALPPIVSDSIEVVALGDDKPRPVEIIARVDVVGPVDFSDIQVLGMEAKAKAPKDAPKIVHDETEVL